jgi:transcriptional regulator with XRE-family HTH domain
MGTPLGEFLRSRRDATHPEAVGLSRGARRRVPGLRRSELATLAAISVEYLVRIEQGRDRNPSVAVVNALADALRLDANERWHLRQLAKAGSATCLGALAEPGRDIRPTVRALLDHLEPGIALLTNRLGDVLAYTSGFDLLARPAGLLDAPSPNLTRFVFTDERARSVFPDWQQVADERAIELCLGPSAERVDRFVAELAEVAGPEFTTRVRLHDVFHGAVLRWHHVAVGDLWLEREVLELLATDAQQLVVFLPANDATADALNRLRREATGTLRAVN